MRLIDADALVLALLKKAFDDVIQTGNTEVLALFTPDLIKQMFIISSARSSSPFSIIWFI